MKMKPLLIPFLVFLMFILLPLSVLAQNTGNDGEEVTVEELYLQNIEIGIIREQAVSINRDAKLLALENIQELVSDGEIDEDSAEAIYLLDYLALRVSLQ